MSYPGLVKEVFKRKSFWAAFFFVAVALFSIGFQVWLFHDQRTVPLATDTPSASLSLEQPKQEEKTLRPVDGPIHYGYGWQIHPVFGDWRYHIGCDILTSGEKPVLAMWSGKVTQVLRDKHKGLTVVVTSGERKVFYGSLAATSLAVNQQIMQGEPIGRSGTCPSEPYFHLHLAVQINEVDRNPLEWL